MSIVLQPYQGDPGLLSGILNVAKKVVPSVVKSIPGVGTIATVAGLAAKPAAAAIGKVLGGSKPTLVQTPTIAPPRIAPPILTQNPVLQQAGVGGAVAKTVPAVVAAGKKVVTALGGPVGAGATAVGLGMAGMQLFGDGEKPKPRRMNPLNNRALKRAVRRQDAFVRAVRSGLKGTKWNIELRSTGRSCRPKKRC